MSIMNVMGCVGLERPPLILTRMLLHFKKRKINWLLKFVNVFCGTSVFCASNSAWNISIHEEKLSCPITYVLIHGVSCSVVFC